MYIENYSVDDFITNKYLSISVKNIFEETKIHRHEFYEMELILEGSGTYHIDHIDYPITAGRLFLMSPVSFHRPHFTSNTRLINCMFTFDGCESDFLISLFNKKTHIHLQLTPSDMPVFSTLSEELIKNTENGISGNRKYSWFLLNSILGKISSLCAPISTDSVSQPLQYTLLFIQNHFAENITLEDAAKAANYSVNYFNDKFKAYTGLTFRQYLIRLRLSFAENLLRYTDLTITDIAEQCGFRDFSNFMTAFKKHHGITPGAFRNL